MRTTGIVVAVALTLMAAGAYAQQGGNSKRPNQAPDKGIDDGQAPPGQAGKEPGDRLVTQVPSAVTANGVNLAELDETFDEAIVLTINPDGTRTYTEVKGLEAAERVVKATTQPAPSSPVLEEK